jgi:hypothetical protein
LTFIAHSLLLPRLHQYADAEDARQRAYYPMTLPPTVGPGSISLDSVGASGAPRAGEHHPRPAGLRAHRGGPHGTRPRVGAHRTVKGRGGYRLSAGARIPRSQSASDSIFQFFKMLSMNSKISECPFVIPTPLSIITARAMLCNIKERTFGLTFRL